MAITHLISCHHCLCHSGQPLIAAVPPVSYLLSVPHPSFPYTQFCRPTHLVKYSLPHLIPCSPCLCHCSQSLMKHAVPSSHSTRRCARCSAAGAPSATPLSSSQTRTSLTQSHAVTASALEVNPSSSVLQFCFATKEPIITTSSLPETFPRKNQEHFPEPIAVVRQARTW